MKKKIIIIFSLILFLFSFFCWFGYQNSELKEIKNRGFLLVGTTGDYCPMSCFDKKTNSYVGFDIGIAEDLAKSLGVKVKYIETSWPTLMQDTVSQKFDIAISGITVTDTRKKQALMSEGYIDNGKTVLCRKEDINKYNNIESINNPNVRVMENPGGLNEKFARENLPNAHLIIHNINYEIPDLVASGMADVMITEVIEADYYSAFNKKLGSPKIQFTRGKIGMLLPKENKLLLIYANKFIKKEQKSGRIDELKRKYIFSQVPLINN